VLVVAIGRLVCYPLPVPRILIAALLAIATASTLASCRRATGEQCERVCWRSNELAYWERFDAEAANLGADAREKLRAERQQKWAEMRARPFDPGLDNCVRQCRRGATPDDVACVERASTAAEAADCLD
jgi:hypothetical protein